MNLLQWTTKPVLGKLFGGILVSACLVASFALIVFIMSGSASPPIFAGSDEIALVGNQLQIRQGELDLKESTPAIGQIFTTGADLPTYELNQITSRFDNASRTRKFDPGVDLHLVSSDVRPDGQSADMTGALQDRQTDFRNPADIDSLDPNSKFMAMWRCNEGNGNGQHCNASGEKIEAKVTNNDAPGPQAVQSRGLASARITNNGVRMYEVSPSESGGWATRVAGDDTYAYGELIAVEVSFSENVWVSSEATFRVQIGSSRRDLVPVSHRADSVIFATLVRASDEDTDGIWIGDNTSTLDHNPANRFQAVNGGGSVSLTHGSLGTQTSHKVDGRSTRPAINRVRITSSPQHREAYVRGEKVQLEVRFDRPVVVSGNPAARLRIEAFGETTTRTANYASGSGTSTLTFEYFASILDNDSDGIAIPANTLAKDGDIALGTEGGGSIKGIRRTVRANLANGSQGSNGSHKVDARFAAIPEIMANALWGWETRTGTSESVTMDFTIREDPGHFSEEYSLVAAFGWSSIGSTRFGFGIRTDVDDPDSDGSEGKGIVFNRWGTHDKTQARPTDDGWVVTGNILGNFISIRKAYDWGAGDYTVRIAQDGDDDADGRWYGMWILNKSTNVETHMGSLKFPFVDGAPPMINPRQDVYSSMMVILGGSAIKPHEIPVFEVALSPPNEGNGVAPPKRFTATYSNLAGVITNAKLSFDRDSNQLIMRAGGNTSRFNAPGPTIVIRNDPATGTPVIGGVAQVGVSLIVNTSGIADADGPDSPSFSYQWVRNDGTSDTDISGAIGSSYTLGTADVGNTIKVRVSFTDDAGYAESLTSDATEAVEQPPLTAEFRDSPASHDGQNTFTFELRFSENIGMSYRTLRDHAFSVTGGEVINARRLDRPRNIRWEITVSPDGNGDVSITLPATTDCSTQSAICASDGRMLSSETTLIVSGPGG